MKTRLPFLFAFLCWTAATQARRPSGDSITALRFMIVSVALDVGLNPILIGGLGPMLGQVGQEPRLGQATRLDR